jgi:hypothetical protein
MLEEHRAELAELKRDYKRYESLGTNAEPSPSLWSLIEGRISDLESMISQDEYWEKRSN